MHATMSTITLPTGYLSDAVAPMPPSAAHRISLALVWLAVASGAVVFSEPAPVDVLTMGLVFGLPAVGLVAVTRMNAYMLSLWLVCAVGAFVAATQAQDMTVALRHTGISLYLYLACFVFAGFVALKPVAHTELIYRAYVAGAVIAALAGISGYFGLIPGAEALFTKYDRAAGPFKDPNVFGPFLVPAVLICLNRVYRSGGRNLVALGIAAFLLLGVLISFSRGAWANLLVSIVVFGVLTFLTVKTNRARLGLIATALCGLIAMLVILVTALQFDKVSKLISERATLTKSYDEGPEGRFGGQHRAIDVIAANPAGIGALEFSSRFHHEEAHNVYLSMFMNAGWAGGLIFLFMTVATCLLGLRAAFRYTPAQPLLIIATAAFAGNALEGAIVDIDHWRHIYLLMAIVWGISSSSMLMCGASNTRRTAKLAGGLARRRSRLISSHARA